MQTSGSRGSRSSTQMPNRPRSTFTSPTRAGITLVRDPRSFAQAWVAVIPTTGGAPAVTAFLIHLLPAGAFRPFMLYSEAAVPATPVSTALRMLVESLGSFALQGSTQNGIAIANPNDVTANVALELFGPDGTSTGLKDNISIVPNGQRALFISELPGLSALPPVFRGVLRVTSAVPVSVMALIGTYNERGRFIMTPTPATPESEIPTSPEL